MTRAQRTASFCILVACLGSATCRVGSALQRNSGAGNLQPPPIDYSAGKPPSGTMGTPPDLGDPTTRREMEERRGKLLNVERQKAMVREAGQIVQMTAELQLNLAREVQGPAREDALKRIETIEKLARNVKDRMKGGR